MQHYLEEIIEKFEDAENLQGVPKFFAFDCCRGEKTDLKSVQNAPKKQRTMNWTERSNDIIALYATISDYVSWSCLKNGSVMMQNLCQVFKSGIPANDDLESMLNRAVRQLETDKIGKKAKSYNSYEFYKQTGEVKVSQNFKKLHFNFKPHH